MAANWSLLPMDVLDTIAMKLQTIEDFLNFSVVCRWWNLVSLMTKKKWSAIPAPWLLLAENTKENPNYVRKIFNLSNNKCYQFHLPETFETRCWGSPYGWVAVIDRDFNVQLFNPITKAKIIFPCLETFSRPLSYDKERVDGGADYIHWVLSLISTRLFILKVSLSGGDRHEFVIMILYGTRKLAFARHGDHSWTPVMMKETTTNKLADVVVAGDIVFALYCDGAIEYWNVKEFQIPELVKPMDYLPTGDPEIFKMAMNGFNQVYLVQSGSDLLMVLRYKEQAGNANDDYDNDNVLKTVDFQVYKLDSKDQRWGEIDDLGDVTLFVGNNSSMCVTIPTPGLRPNSIYFTDDEKSFWGISTDLDGRDMGVFDLKCDQVRLLYQGDDMCSLFSASTFFIPDFKII